MKEQNMYTYSLTHGIGPGERNDRHDLAAFGRKLERATGLDPWLPHAWPMAAFPEARTSDGYKPGFGGALRGFQILAGLDPDGVARSGGPTERALDAALDPARPGQSIDADEVYRGAPPGTGSAGPGRPADGGVKAAAKIRNLAHKAGTAQADSGRAKGGGARRPLLIPTISPPRIRQPVGAGGVNDRNDLLQARRNLARVGYAPRLHGIGEPAAAHSAAVRNGLRAYQQAKGLKADGLMRPGGETERALRRQIAVQQQRLKDRHGEDAAKAKRDLSTVSGTVRAADAWTLGARMTGAAFDRQRSEAYAEALDWLKRAEGGGVEAGGGTEAAATGAEKKARRRPAIHPRFRASAAHAGQRAEARERAAQRAKKAEATEDFAPHAGRLKDRAGRRDAMHRGFALARKRGVLPDQLAGWLEGLLREPDADFAPNDPQGRRLHYSAGPAVEAAREVNRLRRDRPDIWKRLPAAVRRKAAAVGAAQSGMGAGGGADGRDRAVLLRADDLLREIATEGNRRTAADLSRAGFDLLTDLAPVVGDIKAAGEARNFLRHADAAEKAGDTGRAAELRALAGLSLASIVPLARAARAGKKLAARIAALSRRLRGGADADPVIAAIDDRATAAARTGDEGGSRQGGGGNGGAEPPKPGAVPTDAVLKLERWGYRIPGLDKAVSQRVLARMMEAKRKVGKNPTFDDIFKEVVRDLPDDVQRRMRASFSNYLGAAGEANLAFLLTKSGAANIERTSRRFEVADTTFAFDVLTDSAMRVRKGPFGKRAVPMQKSNGNKSSLDSKLGPESGPSKNQREAYAEIKKGKVAKSVTQIDPVEADEAMFLRQDFREMHLPAIQQGFREALERQNLLTGAQIEQVMQNIAAYHKLSKSGVPVSVGEVYALTIMPVAIMKALEDGME